MARDLRDYCLPLSRAESFKISGYLETFAADGKNKICKCDEILVRIVSE